MSPAVISSPIVPEVPEEDYQGGMFAAPTNPFLIPNVVEDILSFLDHSAWKSCRQVCKLWEYLTLPLLRQSSKMELEGALADERSFRFLRLFNNSSTSLLPMSTLTYNAKHCGFSTRTSFFFHGYGASISHLILCAFPLQDPVQEYGTIRFVKEFLQALKNYCPNLKHLSLTNLHQLNYDKGFDDEENDELFNFTHNKIRHLSLSFGSHYSQKNIRIVMNCNGFVRRLISLVPNVLALDTDFKCSGEMYFYFIQTLRDSGVCGKLEEFSVDGGLDNYTLRILNEVEFPKLKVLKLNTDVRKAEQALFQQFLQKLSPTLEQFIMFGNKWGRYNYDKRNSRFAEGFSLDFPLMPKLKTFKNANYEGLRMGNAEFLKRLPNLREISIRDFQPSLGDIAFSPQLTVYGTLFSPHNYRRGGIKPSLVSTNPLVRKLTVDAIFVPTYESQSSIQKIVTLFPNLEELELAISFAFTNDMIGGVFRILSSSKVKVLRIKFYQCSELGVQVVCSSFLSALMYEIPRFPCLQRLEFFLDDMRPGDNFMIPIHVLSSLLKSTTLSSLFLTGFSLGLTKNETEECERLLERQLAQWEVKEQLINSYCDYEY